MIYSKVYIWPHLGHPEIENLTPECTGTSSSAAHKNLSSLVQIGWASRGQRSIVGPLDELSEAGMVVEALKMKTT